MRICRIGVPRGAHEAVQTEAGRHSDAAHRGGVGGSALRSAPAAEGEKAAGALGAAAATAGTMGARSTSVNPAGACNWPGWVRQRSHMLRQSRCWHDAARVFTVRAAWPYRDRERAELGLRGHLRRITLAAGVTPDWSTLTVEGPTVSRGAHGHTWYEWTGTVDAMR